MATERKALKDYGPIQAPQRLGIAVWQFESARRRGLIPAPDCGSRWSATVLDTAERDLADILAAVGDQAPIGANKAATRIGERLDLEVDRAEVDELADRGLITAAGEYKGWPLYDVRDLDEAADRERELVGSLVAERVAWLDRSVSRYEAPGRLGWTRAEFERVAAKRGLEAGRFDRYAIAELDALAQDEELAEQVRGDRVLGPDQAAEHLEVRRRDFDYCVAAGWIKPTRWAESRISQRRTVDVPLFRVADVEALRDIPGVDWEAVRAVKPGDPSPLREFAALPTERATLVRGFAADLAERHGVEIAASYDDRNDQWELRWTPNEDGEPTQSTVRAALNRDRYLRPHAADITLRLVDPETDATSANRQESAR